MEETKGVGVYIKSAADQLIQLIKSIKEKTGLLNKKNIGQSEKVILNEIIMHVNSAEKVVTDLSTATKPWEERVVKKDGAAARELLKDYMETALKHSASYGSSLSLVAFKVSGLEKFTKLENYERGSFGITDLTELVRAGLRRRADFVMDDGKSIYVILPETDSAEARAVAERLLNIMRDYLRTKEGGKSLRIDYTAANSPENGDSFDALMSELK